MLSIKAFAISAFAIASACVTALAQSPPGDLAGSRRAMLEHQAALIAQCPAATRMPEAAAAKLPIDVTRWGNSGPAVLLVHGGVQGGLGGGPKNFAGQETLASKGWQLMVVDRPGFGKSPTRGVDDMEADAVWISDMLGNGANLIGHSWGGAETLLAAARRPDKVRSLVLIEPAVRVLLAGDPVLANDPAVAADSKRFVAFLMKSRTPAEYGIAFARSLSTGDKSNAVASSLEADPQMAMTEGCALLQAHMASFAAMKQAAEIIAKAGVPTLIITGGWNPLYDAGADVLAKLSGGKHVVVRSANHFVQLTSADEFNKVVDAFMRDADAKRPASGK